MGLIKSALVFGALLVSIQAQADWVTAEGEAVIVNGNITKARAEAIEQAVSYASLQAGVSVETTQQTVDGHLTDSSTRLMQQLMSGPVQLVSEQIENNRLRVQLRVELMEAPQSQCQSTHLKAAILLPEAAVRDRSQLTHGQINSLGEAVSQQLARRLDSTSGAAFANLRPGARLDVDPRQLAAPGYRLPGYLAMASDSQYVLVPQITDVSTEPSQSSYFGLVSNAPERQFALTMTLFQGISGEIIWREKFETSAPWEFERTESVSPTHDRFWRSAYGMAVDKLLVQAVKELDKALLCRPVLGQIVARQGQTLILNLGRRHGIKVGDELAVVLAKHIPDRLNDTRTTGNNTKTNISITQVTEDSARAELSGLGSVDNIQISDIAIKTGQNKN
ncbi:flagellar assembly protein FlgT [Shewanella litorisediminis]|uniref:Flagella assembly protein FlgT n=1 Tax=Shewanella litorisediminis TaxID=1173586 RepID=A0ABX7FZY6_9GAMM|nr:flagellar assembly protein FlgT [Shewanella litorisediminis]MCL2919709.1 flagellar assembly protein FlgT [Shewanella litorisediminis]QRH00593.1 flagella assembly protein FlgT [Shewanella litorisediminis]